MSIAERLMRGLDNPIIAKDGISRMRSWRAPLAITLYLGLLGGFGFAVFTISVFSEQFSRSVSAQIGALVFAVLAFFQLTLISLFAPALAAGSISGERERQTFDVLLVSRISAFGIVWGKLVASLAYLLLLILTALPIFAAVFLFGGIDFEQFALAQLITVVMALMLGAVSLFTSALFRRSLPATVTSYAAAFALMAGTAVAGLLLTWVLTFKSGGAQLGFEPHPLLFGNPLYALNVVFQPSGGGLHAGRLAQILILNGGAPSVWGPVIQPWQLCVAGELALFFLSVAGSVALVRGRRAMPLRRPRAGAAAEPAE